MSPRSDDIPPADSWWLRRLSARVADIAFGTDPEVRARTPLGLLAAFLYLPALALIHLYALPHGWVSARLARLMDVYCLVAIFGFYPLVRSGLSKRLKEPSVSLPQMMWADIGAVLVYHHVPTAQPIALQLLSLIQIFGLLRLPPAQTLQAGGWAIFLLLVHLSALSRSGAPSAEVQLDALRVGAACVLLAGLSLLSFRYSKLRLKVETNRCALEDAVRRVDTMMRHDTLTGLLNREGMQALLEETIRSSARRERTFCIVLIDIDHFKRINDTHGHACGDEVLRNFAAAAARWLPRSDVIGRWGGEEFLVVLPHTATQDAGKACIERLLAHVGTQRLSDIQPDLRIGFSAGIATHVPGQTLTRSLERADKALYVAKSAGRGRCVTWQNAFRLQPQQEVSPAPAAGQPDGDATRHAAEPFGGDKAQPAHFATRVDLGLGPSGTAFQDTMPMVDG